MSSDQVLMDMHAMQALRPLLGESYLPFSSASMRPAALALLANEIVLHDRRRMLELGCGLSTIVLGRLLSSRGGRVITVEHEVEWARYLRGLIAGEGLEDTVTLVEAPLVPAPVGQHDWYDLDVISGAVSGFAYDLLLVDGPPAWRTGHELARSPALPLLIEHAADAFTVALDDAVRAGERKIVEAWERECGIKLTIYSGQGIAIGHRGPAPFSLG
jgi:hypothetical protein